MKCQCLFSCEEKKNISKCRRLKILPSMLNANNMYSIEEEANTSIRARKRTLYLLLHSNR